VTLIEFLTARLDEDEAVAEAAAKDAAGYSHGYPNDPITKWRINDERDLFADHVFLAGGAYGGIDEKISAHLVRHDPARVLREVAAKRRVMERHRPSEASQSTAYCAGCAHDPEGWPEFELDDCPELRDLASAWSHHSDYREEWAA
jgi:hypothetical protein